MSHKFTLVSMIAIVPMMTAIADSTITSKGYVDTQIDTTQVKIPATGTGNGGIGNTVMTYTNTPGRIGERGIYTGESSYNASSDADKLITASALKGAFDSIPTTDTTTLVCANPGTCDLWTIVEQTAMGPATGIDLSALVGANSTSKCYKYLKNGTCRCARLNATSYSTCTDLDLLSEPGDWSVTFDIDGETIQIKGVSACSTLNGTYHQPASDQDQVQDDYESNMANAPTNTPIGGNCYCKLTDPEISNARWAWLASYTTNCAGSCAFQCALRVQAVSDLQEVIFGVN